MMSYMDGIYGWCVVASNFFQWDKSVHACSPARPILAISRVLEEKLDNADVISLHDRPPDRTSFRAQNLRVFCPITILSLFCLDRSTVLTMVIFFGIASNLPSAWIGPYSIGKPSRTLRSSTSTDRCGLPCRRLTWVNLVVSPNMSMGPTTGSSVFRYSNADLQFLLLVNLACGGYGLNSCNLQAPDIPPLFTIAD
ncbi:hypothetical protein PM082_024353 [Marasmius tenuissimus]|nr:hypothetical protein PM082_024353 [Marasmius tenuissimus]